MHVVTKSATTTRERLVMRMEDVYALFEAEGVDVSDKPAVTLYTDGMMHAELLNVDHHFVGLEIRRTRT